MYSNRHTSSNPVIRAFIEGHKRSVGSLSTDGHQLALHGNVIAWRPPTGHGVCVTLCGWNTKTTRKYLSLLPGVSVLTESGKPCINGIPVAEDEVLTIRAKGYKKPTGPKGDMWITGKTWVATDGWRGYEEPAYAVCGANDTGMWSDSPCPTTTCKAELGLAEQRLKEAGVKYKHASGQSSNVFCLHRYLIVKPKDMERATELVAPLIQDTRLMYLCNN